MKRPKPSLEGFRGDSTHQADETVETRLTIAPTATGEEFGFSPAWAGGLCGAIADFPVLAGIETILVDRNSPDKKGRMAGPDATRKCADRWLAERYVRTRHARQSR